MTNKDKNVIREKDEENFPLRMLTSSFISSSSTGGGEGRLNLITGSSSSRKDHL